MLLMTFDGENLVDTNQLSVRELGGRFRVVDGEHRNWDADFGDGTFLQVSRFYDTREQAVQALAAYATSPTLTFWVTA